MAALLLTFAVKEEARPFHKLTCNRPELKILITGIGRRNAENAIRTALAGQSPRLVLTCGFAGGLNPELAAGTVIFSVEDHLASPMNPPPTPSREGSQISDRHFPSREGTGVGSGPQKVPAPPDRLATLLITAGARPARFQFVERIVTSAMEKRALRQHTGSDAVEM